MTRGSPYTIALSDVDARSVDRVGGKNASLGELINALAHRGIAVPAGFATTVEAYRAFLRDSGIDSLIGRRLKELRSGYCDVASASRTIREAVLAAEMPLAIRDAITDAYCGLDAEEVAVRSSATAEDTPRACFAGQYETFLNVRGEESVIAGCKRCFASLFSERAIAYREENGLDHIDVAMSVGVQRMVRSDLGSAGVMFTIDTETGFPHTILINAGWGLGKGVVQGCVDPDEFTVFKPMLSDPRHRPIIGKSLGRKLKKFVYASVGGVATTALVDTGPAERKSFALSEEEILTLARWGVAIERHYRRPMDVEWAKDGLTGELFVVRARPETVQSKSRSEPLFRSYTVKRRGEPLLSGHAIGDGAATGRVCRLDHPAETDGFTDGCVLVTRITDPDWLPLMRRAAAIVTDHGGRTSHAAIVSRELGVPAVTGTERATRMLNHGREVTVSCAEGERGHVYAGRLDIAVDSVDLAAIPRTRTKVMLNIGDPAQALRWWRLPADGVGLARIEFIISNSIKCHPLALARFESIEDGTLRRRIEAVSAGYKDKRQFFVATLAHGIARIAAALYPKPVVVRMSDFKSNEYADLIGGRAYEPKEENPMLGWRGASRYYHDDYREGFEMECEAIRRVRDSMGLSNLIVMIPFCRTPGEADKVLEALQLQGLGARNGVDIYMMCEVPSNAILLEHFAERFAGFSIGSNDMTQLVLGIDRDSPRLAELFDVRDDAVVAVIGDVIRRAHACGRKVGLCGQGPSDHPDFARSLVAAGIDSVSVTPDSFLRVKREIARLEAAQSAPAAERRGVPLTEAEEFPEVALAAGALHVGGSALGGRLEPAE